MTDISVSLWLPVGRVNFYSETANNWLKGTGTACFSETLDISGYIPAMQCSVLRRLLEVMPLSFGYDAMAELTLDDEEPDEHSRPIGVTMTLDVVASLDVSGGLAHGHRYDDQSALVHARQRANRSLHQAGVGMVRMHADEHGNYTFTATPPDGLSDDGSEAVRQALYTHVKEVFGGSFEVNRTKVERRHGFREGSAAVRRYCGLSEQPPPATNDADEVAVGPPAGALTFVQLNTLIEGICNESLWPAVFFERYDLIQTWKQRGYTSVTPLHTVGDIVDILKIDGDTTTLEGEIITIRHFLSVTSRESLQRIKWSVESVRRGLLDEMMSVLHRQSRLIQLDLGAVKSEHSPELALDASESQMRGYVMLAAAKVPLIGNVYEQANLTVDHIKHRARLTIEHTRMSHEEKLKLQDEVYELNLHLGHWRALLDGLRGSIGSLTKAVEQAWMERLLSEQQQSRSEQEAMAEIERSRYGRPDRNSLGSARTSYDALNFLAAVLAILIVVVTTTPGELFVPGQGWWQTLVKLWPIGVVALLILLVIPGVGSLLRWRRDMKGATGSYSYEFAFLFDEQTTPELVQELTDNRKRQRIRRSSAELLAKFQAKIAAELTNTPKPSGDDGFADAEAEQAAAAAMHLVRVPGNKRIPGLSLRHLGGGRIERTSADNASLKLHSIVSFRVSRFKYARFEVVEEITANRVSETTRLYLHQVRMFGDSPKPLDKATIIELIDVIHVTITLPLALDREVDDPLLLLRRVYA